MSHKPSPLNPRMRDTARKPRHDMTGPERALWHLLRARRLDGLKFRRQHPVGPFVADFCCEEMKLIVALDGRTHIGTGESDDQRTDILGKLGYRVVRFTNDDVIESPEAVARTILRECGRLK
ncbi:MAG: DUF559 domain-containing protein [Phycisphaeraceae bacterium]